MVRLNNAGLTLIKDFEGLRTAVYTDAAGKRTIGYGHVLTGQESFTIITESQAEHILEEDIANVEWYLKKYVEVDLGDYQWAALVSFTFNVGQGALQRSTLLQLLNQGKYDAVPGEMLKYNMHKDPTTGKMVVSDGLRKRRQAEGFLWQRPMYEVPKPLYKSRTLIGGALAGVSTSVTIGADVLSQAVHDGRSIVDNLKLGGIELPWLQILLAVVAAFGIGLSIYARINDRKAGRV